jgi:hypothetical protein
VVAAATLSACLTGGVVFAAPDAYSINSDSDSDFIHDSLYVIDLANGSETRIGRILSLNQLRTDVEGLALAPDGTLYGVDDDSNSLFPINVSNGSVISGEEVFINGIPDGGGNDYGMTFACDGDLYVTSVSTQTLYRMGLDGQATPVGAQGSLGVGISAIAAYGNPVQLFGLSNGTDTSNPGDVRKLWSINPTTGVATEIGSLGGAALQYAQAGLAFDEAGMLWALTDRRDDIGFPLPGQILRLNTNTGSATAIANTTDNGFESLAISPPQGCFVGGGQTARFAVNKRFMDRNDVDGATFTLSCNTGIPLEQSLTVEPIIGAYHDFEVNFVVRDFESGTLDCELSEEVPTGYQPTYACDGMSACSAGAGSPLDPYFRGPCSFSDVEEGDENICFIRNYVAPVDVDVTKLWVDEREEFQGPTNAQMAWACVNARSSGNDMSLGTEEGFLEFHLSEETQAFSVYPNFDPDRPTVCSVTEAFPGFDSDIESDASECQGLTVALGTGAACTIVNTRFYAGIPTLSDYGKLLMALLMLGAGFIAVRRIA